MSKKEKQPKKQTFFRKLFSLRTLKTLFKPSPFKVGLVLIAILTRLFFLRDQTFQQIFYSIDDILTMGMFNYRGVEPDTGKVIIVDIDEKSLKKLGQWPWPRKITAKIIENLGNAEAKVIGLDMFFVEKDRSSPANYLPLFKDMLKNNITINEEAMDNDLILGEAVGNHPVILGYTFQMTSPPEDFIADLPFPLHMIENTGQSPFFSFIKAQHPLLNVPEISANSYSEGHVNVFPERSGMIRSIPLILEYSNIGYPSLALEMYLSDKPDSVIKPGVTKENTFALKIEDTIIPTDPAGRMMLNFRGPARSFKYISAVDVYNNKFPANIFRNKYVLLGTSAIGLSDLVTTPMGTAVPGVEAHATALDNMIRGDAMKYNRQNEAVIVLSLLTIGGVLLAAAMAYTRPLISFTAGIGFLFIIIFGNFHWFFLVQEVVGASYLITSILLIMAGVSAANYFFEGRKKQYIRKAFAHYVSPHVVSELVKNPEKLNLEGEQRVVSILFSDIRGFTTISEGMNAEELSTFMNEYLGSMTDCVLELNGTVDKFIGDAIMAIWGAPLDNPEHPADSIRSALLMKEKLDILRPQWEKRGLPTVNIGIGINTGLVSVGNMGTAKRFDYTVIGDHVNLASRLEGLNKPYGTTVIVSEFTKAFVENRFFFRFVDKVRVKGKNEPISIFEPLLEGKPAPTLQVEVETYEKALNACFEREFEPARKMLSELMKTSPHPLYKLHLERVEEYLLYPPPNEWDGVFTHTTK